MNEKDWLNLLNSKPKLLKIVFSYCVYKGKSQEETAEFLQLTQLGFFHTYGVSINSLAEEVITNICNELDFIEIRDKEENIINYYKNNPQLDGKEILKV